MKFKVLLFAFSLMLLIYPNSLHSQSDSTLLLEGKIMNTSFRPLGFSHIWSKNGNNGTVANIHGEFKLSVYPGEEILISSLGYKSQSMKIPTIAKEKLYKSFFLRQDTLQLEEAVVRPWPATYRKLKEKIASMDFEDRYVFNTNDKFLQKEIKTAQKLAMRNSGIAPVAISGPISLLYSAFGNKPKQLKQLPKDKKRIQRDEIIKSKFNLEIIKKVTKMQDQDSINNFIAYCDFDENYLLNVDKYELVIELQRKFNKYCLEIIN